jgi:DNA-binding MarR family transcriptional regulator
MHTVFFDLKRAYHSTLRLTRRLLKRLGLTAARFDLLYIVEKAGKTMMQCELRRVLGVTAPTVSRMLASLEALGWVEREVVDVDRRRRHVSLTKAGLRCVRRAARSFIHSGWVELAVDSALCPHRWFNALECSLARGVLSKTLERLRDAYGDRATRTYPWFYDEDFEEDYIVPLRSWVTEAVE